MSSRDERTENMKYKDLLDRWLEDQRTYQKYSTYSLYYNLCQNHIIPALGSIDIEHINQDIVQEFILQKLDHGNLVDGSGLSMKYVKDLLCIINLTLGKGLEIRLPYESPKQIEIFEKDEQIALINHLQSNINPRNFGILLCIHTGMRIGELCALKWSDIDLMNRTVKIDKTMIRTYTKLDGSVLRVTPPKSRSSNRVIPLNSTIMYYANLSQCDDETYVISGSDHYIEPNKYRLYYNRILKNLGIEHKKFHSLRHTFATRCIECGCDYKSLSQLLGHSNVAITMNLYVHPQMELKRKCVELLVEYYK